MRKRRLTRPGTVAEMRGRRKGLSLDAAVIKALSAVQPSSFKNLIEELEKVIGKTKAHRASKTVKYDILPLLERTEIVKVFPAEDEPLYALWFYSKPEYEVRKAIEGLRMMLLRDPELEEVALEVGKPPEAIRETFYKVASATNWRGPTENEKSENRRRLHWIAREAACIQYNPEEDPNLNADAENYVKKYIDPSKRLDTEVARLAKDYARRFPDLIPKIQLSPLEKRKEYIFGVHWPVKMARFIKLDEQVTFLGEPDIFHDFWS